MPDASSKPRLLTLASGGWVLLLTGLLCLGIMVWAIAPAVMKSIRHPPGDGKNIDSYGFDLTNLSVPRDLVAPAMLHRDMVPVMTDPTATGPDPSLDERSGPDWQTERWKNMQKRSDPQYGKYLVSSDRVIGVQINGAARAYPISVMYVHEIINDTLGPPTSPASAASATSSTPIAVTYNWLCDSTVVFDRRVNGRTLEFGVSGLVYNSNMLMYDRQPSGKNGDPSSSASPVSGESLWSQLLMRAVSGPAAKEDLRLDTIPAEIALWSDWSRRFPQTTVLDRDVRLAERYKDAAPTQYFHSDELLFPVRPLPGDKRDPKTPVLGVVYTETSPQLNGLVRRRVYWMPYLITQATHAPQTNEDGHIVGGPQWSDTLGSVTLRFIFDRTMQTVRVETDPPGQPIQVVHAFWFAWHAMYPEDQLADGRHRAWDD